MIPIIEENGKGGYLISSYVEDSPIPKFEFDEEEINLEREEKFYNSTLLERKKEQFEFERELKQDHSQELIEIFKNQKQILIQQYSELTENFKECTMRGRELWLCQVFKDIEFPELKLKKIKQLITDIDFLQGRKYNQEEGISDDDIVRAKNHPFETLIENQNLKAKCPFHPDNTPSFSIHKKGNFAYCFSCNKGVDTIQFIMETKNLNFIEAVKFLR